MKKVSVFQNWIFVLFCQRDHSARLAEEITSVRHYEGCHFEKAVARRAREAKRQEETEETSTLMAESVV